jgi:hypothetical protein
MNRSAVAIRIAALVVAFALFGVVLTRTAGASPRQYQGEPTPRPTATPAPFLELDPSEAPAGQPTQIQVTGSLWVQGYQVQLFWDDRPERISIANVEVDGTFRTRFTTPTDEQYGSPGTHTVTAVQDTPQGQRRAEATILLLAPTVTNTPTVTMTPTPTYTPTDTRTPTPITPTPTASPSPTFTPSPTLRPVTPMVTITPFPPTKPPSRPPSATRTNTPVPGTATMTYTPSPTSTPSQTPGPGTPSATPEPMATATPVEEISETGGGLGTLFLWGFVLAGLLVVFRLLRVRSLAS